MCSLGAELVLLVDSPRSSSSPSPVGGGSNESSSFPVVVSSVKKPRRNVTFRESRTEIHIIESLASLSKSERDKLWYTDDEVDACKGRARELSERIKQGLAQEDEIRGLELRLSQDRQRRKYMILQAILRAQRRYKDPRQLSNIARKCNVWSKSVAAIAAQHDYCSLYVPERIDSIASVPPLEKHPLPFKSKDPPLSALPIRRPRSPIPQQRRVRSRPAPEPCALSC